jgi:HK97 family phage major capsid protein
MATLEAETPDDRPQTIAELDSAISDITTQISELNTEFSGKRFTKEAKEKWNQLHEQRDDPDDGLKAYRDELQLREDMIGDAVGKGAVESSTDTFQTRRPGSPTGGDIYDLSTVRRMFDDPSVEGNELRDRAKKALESAVIPHPQAEAVDAKGHVERLIGMEPEDGRLSRYLVATDSPTYKRAWTKTLAYGLAGQSPMLSREEQAAINGARAAERAMSLTTTSGGFAVPFVLDPTIIQTGSGAINPYRAIGNVSNISVDEWRGVSSAGVTATFQAEAAAVTDASPTLAQPVVSTEMARAFVPFSIEIGQDWGGFASEMAGMFADSKDVLEATKMALGSGTNEPFGVITGATTVFTASNTNSVVLADVYGVRNALGPRFRNRASWTLNNSVADKIRQFDTAGGAGLWIDNLRLRSAASAASMQDARLGADLLGHAAYEATAQSGTFTTGQLIGVIGDFNYYKIVDRIGMNVEVIQHIFGAGQGNLPTGQRGLFAYWRVGAKVLDANAFRTLKLA